MAFNPFVNSFTNSPIQPSNATFLEIVAATDPVNVTLEWVFQNPSTLYPFANFIQITGNPTSTFTIMLPNALYTGLAQFTIIQNTTDENVEIVDQNDDVVGVVTPFSTGDNSNCFYVGCTDNTTAAGVWAFITFGTATSTVNASALVDPSTGPGGEPNAGGLIAVGSYLKINQSVFTNSAASYTGKTSDRGNIVNWTGGSGTYTLLLSTTAGNGFITGLQNSGSGSITISPSGSDTIDGSASVVIQSGESTYLISDGNGHWFTFCFSSNLDFVVSEFVTSLSTWDGTNPINISLAGSQSQIQIFTGQYTPNTTATIPVTVPANVQEFSFLNSSTTNSVQVYVFGETNTSYKYTILPGASLNAFVATSPATHLYSIGLSDEISLADGTATVPPLNFVNAPTTGLYRQTSGSQSGALTITQGGTPTAAFLSSGIYPYVATFAPTTTPTALVPAYSFVGATNSGMGYIPAGSVPAAELVFIVLGTQQLAITRTQLLAGNVNSNTAPVYSFANANSTGMGLNATNATLNIIVGGVDIIQATGGTLIPSQILIPTVTTNTSPTLTFQGSGNPGLSGMNYSTSNSCINFPVNGTLCLSLTTTQLWGLPSTSENVPTYSFQGFTGAGMGYDTAESRLTFSVGSVQILQATNTQLLAGNVNSNTAPVYSFANANTTGIGLNATNATLNIIAGGVDIIQVAGTTPQFFIPTVTTSITSPTLSFQGGGAASISGMNYSTSNSCINFPVNGTQCLSLTTTQLWGLPTASENLPTYSFQGFSTTGMGYDTAESRLTLTVSTIQILQATNSQLMAWPNVNHVPTYSFAGLTNNGMGIDQTNPSNLDNIYFQNDGVNTLQLSTAGTNSTNPTASFNIYGINIFSLQRAYGV